MKRYVSVNCYIATRHGTARIRPLNKHKHIVVVKICNTLILTGLNVMRMSSLEAKNHVLLCYLIWYVFFCLVVVVGIKIKQRKIFNQKHEHTYLHFFFNLIWPFEYILFIDKEIWEKILLNKIMPCLSSQ